jgi:hypothetical protein
MSEVTGPQLAKFFAPLPSPIAIQTFGERQISGTRDVAGNFVYWFLLAGKTAGIPGIKKIQRTGNR